MNNPKNDSRTFTDYELSEILRNGAPSPAGINERNVTRTVEAQRWFNLLLHNTDYELFAGVVTVDKLRELALIITDKLNE